MNKKRTTEARLNIRVAELDDVDALVAVEQNCFDNDRLNKRSFRRWIQAEHGELWVAEQENLIAGYGLLWCHRGTRQARLYSLAVQPEMRGQGIALKLLDKLEEVAAQRARLFMRLEVAKDNRQAIGLYEARGYRVFGEYVNYYEDHGDALRMQKTIQHVDSRKVERPTPWYQQTTEFTCGPAALLMAMASLGPEIKPDQCLELDIWREATTIFMTSGLGGCHPLGLALAAQKRGFEVSVYLNSKEALFLNGVRSQHKKDIMSLVHKQFLQQVNKTREIKITYQDITQQKISNWLEKGYAVIALISTYRLDGKKAPHWVAITHVDEHCFYVHDPDLDAHNQQAIDCQYVPIARADFSKMSTFGNGRLRTALALKVRKIDRQ